MKRQQQERFTSTTTCYMHLGFPLCMAVKAWCSRSRLDVEVEEGIMEVVDKHCSTYAVGSQSALGPI